MTDNLISRRRVLTLLAGGAGALAASPFLLPTSDAVAASGCGTESNEVTIGPYYVDEGLVRSDITSGQSGVPLTLTLTFLDVDTCEPLSGAAVDIWHANAAGHYSDEQSEGTLGQTYLRGIQITDDQGQVTFTTVFPGWYQGRTVHIHSKVRTGGTLSGTSYSGGTTQWIGQVFFDEATTEAVAKVAPYSSSTTTRTTNSQDSIFGQSSPETTCAISGSTSAYTATAAINVAAAGAEGTTTTGTPCTITGATTRTTTYGSTVVVAGTAAAGATVDLYSKVAGTSSYSLARTLTADSSGAWSTSYTASKSYSLYAEADDDVSDVIAVLVAPTIAGASSRKARRGSRITLSGTSVPGTAVTLYVWLSGTKGYVPVSNTTGSNGVWSRTWTVKGNYHVYAVGSDGLQSRTYLVYAT